MMRAARFHGQGGPDVVRIDEVPRPVPAPGEVLVRVSAFGLNNAEVLQRRGVVPAPAGGVPGLECVGRVVETRAGADGPAVGDRVGVLLRGGGYADYVAAPAGACLPVPDDVDEVKAAAVPEAAVTAWWNLVHRGRVRSGERVLVHGAAGGVGMLAAQLARELGAEVIGTARGAAKVGLCRQLKVPHVIDYGADDVAAAVLRQFPGGVDVILDNQGGPALERNVGMLAPLGRLVIVGTQAGPVGELDVGRLMGLGAEVSSSSLGKLDDARRVALCAEVGERVLPLVASGGIVPVVDSVFPFPASSPHTRGSSTPSGSARSS
ncbi:zinc-binding dehydrogenase [Prauserella oleivorans]